MCAGVAFVVALVLAGFAASRLIDVDAWRDDVAVALSFRTGFDVRIAGRLRLVAGLRPSLLVAGIEIRSAGDSEGRPLARVAAMEFEADLLRSYRERKLVLSQARASGVSVLLVRAADGAGNWELPDAPAPPVDPARGVFTQFALERVVLENAQVRYETAVSDWTFELDVTRLDVEAPRRGRKISFDATGTVQDHPFDLRIHSEGNRDRVGGWLGPGALIDLSLSAHVGPLELAMAGRLSDPRGDARADLAVSLHLDRLEDLAEFLPIPKELDIVGMGEADIRAQLVGGDGAVRLDDVVVTIDSKQTGHVEGRGQVGDLIRARQIDLSLSLSTPNAEAITRRLGLPTPKAGAAQGTSRLRIDGLDIRFEGIDVDATHSLGAALRVNGDVRGLNPGWAATLDFEVDARRMGDLQQILEEVATSAQKDGRKIQIGRPGARLQRALMAIGPVRAKGRLEGGRKQWAINGIEGTAGTGGVDWMHSKGRIASVAPRVSGLVLDIEAGSDDFEALAARAGVPVVGLERLRLKGQLVGDADRSVLTRMQAVASTPDRITLGVTGDLPIGDDWLATDLTMAVSANDLATFGEVIDRSFPATGPLELSTRIRSEGDALLAEDMVIGIGQSVIRGDLRIATGRKRQRVTADLHSERIELRDIGIAPDPSPDTATEDPKPAVPWYDVKIPFEDLIDSDGSLSLQADKLVGRAGFEVSDVRLQAKLDRGVLSIDDLRLAYQGGQALVSLRADASKTPPEVALRLGGGDFRVERVVAQFLDGPPVAYGTGELNGKLRARGRTPSELAASVTGNLLFIGRAGGLSMRYSRALQLDIGPTAARRAARGDFERIECLVIDAVASEGIVSLETLFLDTEDKQVLGSGRIDLRNEKIDVLLTPVLKQAIPGSVAAAVRVSGPLGKPDVSAAPLATASATAQGLVDRALLPLHRVLPGVGGVVDDLRRGADRALSESGVNLPTAGLWRPGIDVSCEKLLNSEKIQASRSGTSTPKR